MIIENLFKGRANLRNVTIELPVTGSADNAFRSTPKLGQVTINNFNATSLNSMFEGSGINYIPDFNFDSAYNVFRSCQNFTNMNYDFHGTNYRDMFTSCPLEEVTFTNLDSADGAQGAFSPVVKNINIQANTINLYNLCRNCVNLEYVNLEIPAPASLEALNTFDGCCNLKDLNLTNISLVSCFNTFRECRNLTNVAKLSPIGATYQTFYNCVNLTDFGQLNLALATSASEYDSMSMLEGMFWNTGISNFDMIIEWPKSLYLGDMVKPRMNGLQEITRFAPVCNTINWIGYVASGSPYANAMPNLTELNFSRCNYVHIPFMSSASSDTGYWYKSHIQKVDFTNVRFIRGVNPNGGTQILEGAINLVDVILDNSKMTKLNNNSPARIDEFFIRCNNLSNASVLNIVNFALNSTEIPEGAYRNLLTNSRYSPLVSTPFDNSYYPEKWSELTAANWTY
jgi:hypothetical protein